jgi:nickel transport protein
MLLDRKPRRSWGATLTVLALGIVVALPMVSHVWAHKVNVFAWVEGDTVFVEGYFPGGKKSQDSLVEVFNSAGTKLLEGRTNKKGEFSFKIPEKTDLKIILTSSMGHKNDFIVPASNFQEVESSPSSPAQSFAESARDSSAHPADLSQLEGMIDKALDRKLAPVIDKALDRKLAPVIKLIRDTRKEGPTIAEIVGGIGYIFGLVGVAVYFSNRKKGTRRKAQD